MCKKKGIEYPSGVSEKLNQYLKNIEDHFPKWYSKETKISIVCYSLYVLTKQGEDLSSKAAQIFGQNVLKSLPLECLGWLLIALNKNNSLNKKYISNILDHLSKNVKENSKTANFITSYGEDGKIKIK